MSNEHKTISCIAWSFGAGLWAPDAFQAVGVTLMGVAVLTALYYIGEHR